MDYEKRYNEALKWIRELYPGLHGATKEDAEHYFPELRESEDERMTREFNDWLCEEIECRTNDLRDEKDRRTLNMLCYVLTKVKEWLEKQKELTPADGWDYADKRMSHPLYLEGFETGRAVERELSEFEKQKEQKNYNKLYEDIAKSEWFKKAYKGKSLGCDYEQKEQQSAEWSEEDEKTINDACCWIAEYAGYLMNKNYGKASMLMGLTDKLKSLRPSWKPSEEHLSALLAVLNDTNNIGSQTCQLALTDLYEQLKKL